MELNNIGNKNKPAVSLHGIEHAELGAFIPGTLYEGKPSCEISEDFTLPEYLPEIRRLLRVTGIASSPEKYVSTRALGISGKVDYCVLYVGSDGRMHSASFSDVYEMNAPFFDDAEWDESGSVYSSVLTDLDGIVSKVTGARKINIRSHVVSDIKVLGEVKVGEISGITHEPHLQMLFKTCEYSKEIFGESVESEAVDELELSGGERYIFSSCRVCVDSAAAFVGYVECRGTVIMHHLIERDNGRLYDIVRKIPFNESVEVDGIGTGMPVIACGSCVAIKKTVNEKGDAGTEDEISVSARIRLCVKGYKNHILKYVKDAFSTAYECETRVKTVEMPRLIACSNRNMTLSETKGIDVLCTDAEGVEICDVAVNASTDGVGISSSGKYVINGNCRFSVIFISRVNDGEDVGGSNDGEYYSAEVEIPFKYECSEGGALPDGVSIRIEAVEPRVRCDAEKVDFGCELMLSYGFLGVESISSVEGIALGDEVVKELRGYTVCYPSAKDTLWSISKKYGTPLDITAKSNGIDANAEADTVGLVDGVRYMIV